jgi:hypothetical protein
MISNENICNYKVLDIVKYYNFVYDVSPSEVKNLEISFLKPEDLKMYI